MPLHRAENLPEVAGLGALIAEDFMGACPSRVDFLACRSNHVSGTGVAWSREAGLEGASPNRDAFFFGLVPNSEEPLFAVAPKSGPFMGGWVPNDEEPF
jgi:hypothetical protein